MFSSLYSINETAKPVPPTQYTSAITTIIATNTSRNSNLSISTEQSERKQNIRGPDLVTVISASVFSSLAVLAIILVLYALIVRSRLKRTKTGRCITKCIYSA